MRTKFLNTISTLSLTLLVCTTLIGAVTDIPHFMPIAWVCLFFYCFLQFPQMSPVAKLFIVIWLGVIIFLAFAVEPAWQDISQGLDKSVFMVTFVACLSFLRGAATGSHIIRRSGQHLLTQPPGRRYLALSLGGHFFGVIISFGVITLLGSMVMQNQGHRSPEEKAYFEMRKKHGMAALMRGFSATTFWNPLSVSLAIAMSLYPQASLSHALPLGFLTAMLVLAVGWGYDHIRKQGKPPSLTMEQRKSSDRGWSVHFPLFGIIILIFAAIAVVKLALGTSIILAVMITVPLISITWRLTQTARPVAAKDTKYQEWKRAFYLMPHWIAQETRNNFPSQRNESAILTCAAFIGSVAAAHLDPTVLVNFMQDSHMPSWLLPPLAIIFMIAGVQIGGSPVLFATILGAAFAQPDALGLSDLTMLLTYVVAARMNIFKTQ